MQHAVLNIPEAEKAEMRAILARKTPSPDHGSDDVIRTFTARFPNGFEVDIKVCNGDGPYVDPVLFDANGHELTVGEVTDELTGLYRFEHHGETFQVNVL